MHIAPTTPVETKSLPIMVDGRILTLLGKFVNSVIS